MYIWLLLTSKSDESFFLLGLLWIAGYSPVVYVQIALLYNSPSPEKRVKDLTLILLLTLPSQQPPISVDSSS